jgi:hypothetical protein
MTTSNYPKRAAEVPLRLPQDSDMVSTKLAEDIDIPV